MKTKELLMVPLRHFRIIGMLYKEFKLLIKMKKAPVLVLALPIILMVIYSAGSSALSSPSSLINAGVCNFDPSSAGILQSVQGNLNIHVLNGDDCLDELIGKVKSGEYLIGFVIPQGFSDTISSAKQASINYYVDDSKPLTSSLIGIFLERAFDSYSESVVQSSEQELKAMSTDARNKLDDIMDILNLTSNVLEENKLLFSVAYPLMSGYLVSAIEELNVYDEELGFVQNLSVEFLTKPVTFNHWQTYEGINSTSFNFASIYAIISLFTLLLLASTGVIYDKKTDYLLRIKATRTFIPTYILSKLIFYIVLSMAQLLIVMGLISLQGAVFKFDFLALMAAMAVVTVFNTSIGLLIGKLSENENIAILSSLILCLPLLFLSGVFFPLEFMPDYIKVIAEIVPLYKEINLLKQASALGASVGMMSELITNLGILSLVVLTVNYLLIKYKQ